MLNPNQEINILLEQNVKKVKKELNGQINQPQACQQLNLDSQQKQQWNDENDKEQLIDLSKKARLKKLINLEDQQNKIISGLDFQQRLREFYKKRIQSSQFYDWADLNQIKKLKLKKKNEELQRFLDNFDQFKDSYQNQSKDLLLNKFIDIKLISKVKKNDRDNQVVQTIDFNQQFNNLFLASGYSKIVRLYQIEYDDEEKCFNDIKLKSNLLFSKFPIQTAKFIQNGTQILATGLKRYLLLYDLQKNEFEKIANNLIIQHFQDEKIKNFSLSTDKYISLFNCKGELIFLQQSNKQYIFTFKMNGQKCNDICISSDENYCFASGDQGKIFIWDLRKRQIINCLSNFGASEINCLSYANNQLAAGSKIGVVHYFQDPNNSFNSSQHTDIMNLTTSITQTNYNHDGQILIFSSKWKANSIRILHSKSASIFQNWPSIIFFNFFLFLKDMRTNLSRIHALALSNNSQFMAIGNELGNIKVYNIKYYN